MNKNVYKVYTCKELKEWHTNNVILSKENLDNHFHKSTIRMLKKMENLESIKHILSDKILNELGLKRWA